MLPQDIAVDKDVIQKAMQNMSKKCLNVSVINSWNDAGALVSPKFMTKDWKRSLQVLKAGFYSSPSANLIMFYAL
jgi:hypothetical protein